MPVLVESLADIRTQLSVAFKQFIALCTFLLHVSCCLVFKVWVSAKEIYLLDITGNHSKFRILSLLLYELALVQDDLALAQVEGRALVQDARLGPVAVAGGG